MADNTVLSPGAGGDTLRDIDKGAGVKTQVVALDLGGAGPESLLTGTLPVSAASLPLPTGAATAANQATEIAALGAPADLEAAGDGSIIALLKRLRTLLGVLRLYAVPVAEVKVERQRSVQITMPQIVLEKRDVRFLPGAAPDTWRAVISQRFAYQPPPEATRQAQNSLNRMRADEEAIVLLM